MTTGNRGRNITPMVTRRYYFRFIAVFILMVISLACLQHPAAADETIDSKYPGFSNGLLKSALLVDLPGGVILEAGSVLVKEDALRSQMGKYDQKIRSQLERNLFFVLEQEATRKILVAEAKSAGVAHEGGDEDELIGLYLNTIAEQAEVSDGEVTAFYNVNKEMVGGASFDQVKEPIRQVLLQHKKETLVQEYLQNLGQNRKIRLDRAWVERQHGLAMDNPVDKARRSGKPTMIEFGATGCIPCDMMQPVLESLRKKFGSELNVIFVHVREQQILGARYGISAIPVQIFFDAQGREVFRHEGFFPEDKIIPILKDMEVG